MRNLAPSLHASVDADKADERIRLFSYARERWDRERWDRERWDRERWDRERWDRERWDRERWDRERWDRERSYSERADYVLFTQHAPPTGAGSV
ncbi:unnamed protein product [Lampetra planeri]